MNLRPVAASLAVVSGLIVACGGNVVIDSTHPSGGLNVGGAAGAAGKSAAGGSIAIGSGGSIATGSSCCTSASDCGGDQRCLNGFCAGPLPDGRCWDDGDCIGTEACQGRVVGCPCGGACSAVSVFGTCTNDGNEGDDFGDDIGVGGATQTSCCESDADCASGDECVKGTCELPLPQLDDKLPSCWRDSDCVTGSTCLGAHVCGCESELCPTPDAPGTCGGGCITGGACGPDGSTCIPAVTKSDPCCGDPPLTCVNGTWGAQPVCNPPAQMCPDPPPTPGSACNACGLPQSCFYSNNSCSGGAAAYCDNGKWMYAEPPCQPCSDTEPCNDGFICVVEGGISSNGLHGACHPNPCPATDPLSCSCAASVCEDGDGCGVPDSNMVVCSCLSCAQPG